MHAAQSGEELGSNQMGVGEHGCSEVSPRK